MYSFVWYFFPALNATSFVCQPLVIPVHLLPQMTRHLCWMQLYSWSNPICSTKRVLICPRRSSLIWHKNLCFLFTLTILLPYKIVRKCVFGFQNLFVVCEWSPKRLARFISHTLSGLLHFLQNSIKTFELKGMFSGKVCTIQTLGILN